MRCREGKIGLPDGDLSSCLFPVPIRCVSIFAVLEGDSVSNSAPV
jgi:hypothetical protein